MTNATMRPQFKPGRSPLLALAAVAATALTIGAAVLLPSRQAPSAPYAPPVFAGERVDAQQPTQLVNLPAVEVVGTRPTKSAENNRASFPVMFKEKS